MSTQELTYYLPKLSKRPLARKLAIAKLKARKFAKAKMKKTKAKSVAIIKRQYFLTAAKTDLQIAIQKNEDIFFATLILVLAVSYSFATTASDLLLLFFKTALDASLLSGISMLFLAMAATITACALGGWITAFCMNALSLAVMDGATGKQQKSFRNTLRQGLSSASRTATAWLILASLVMLPLLGLTISGAVYVFAAHLSVDDLVRLIPQAVVLTTVTALTALMHFALLPFVVLFERKLTYRQAIARSRQLVSRRGKWFIAAAYVCFVAYMAAGYFLANFLEPAIGLGGAVTLSVFGITGSLGLHGLLTMLYRKRRLARTN